MKNDNLINSVLGHYEIRERLGKGGMGTVYRAFQTNLNREVAVKVLAEDLAGEPHFVERFNREAKTAAGLEHSHIVPLYDYGSVEGIVYVVMRLLDGGSLADRLRNAATDQSGLPTLEETTNLLVQIAGALDYAHQQGVIHRDIKPSNIMYDGVGNVFIVDFGIAKLVNATSQFTAAGMIMGTPSYMAPEQWRNEKISAVTDQYAVGVMIYQMIVGRPPFEAPTPYGLMHKHINDYPTPPHTARDDVSESVSNVLAQAMAKKPNDRFPSMSAFSAAFREAIERQQLATTDAPTPSAAVNSTPLMAPTVTPHAEQIMPDSGPLKASTLPQTPEQQMPWNVPPATKQQPRQKTKISPYMGLVGVVIAIVAIVVGVVVLSGGDDGNDDVQVSSIERAERYLGTIAEENVVEAKENACSDVFDETESIIETIGESGGILSLEDVACEADGRQITCMYSVEGIEETTYFTVDRQDKVCGGELIDLVRSLDDVSSEESSSQRMTFTPRPTTRVQSTPIPTVISTQAGLSVGDEAPAFSLQSATGEMVSLADYSGRPVLLYFHMAVG